MNNFKHFWKSFRVTDTTHIYEVGISTQNVGWGVSKEIPKKFTYYKVSARNEVEATDLALDISEREFHDYNDNYYLRKIFSIKLL